LASKPPIFTRNSTGLVRELSAFAVFSWVVVYFPWLSSWAGIFWVTPGYYHNVDYYASLAVWAVIAMVIVLLYWQMTVIMPRSGGDYVFISRTLTPLVGFVAGFLFFVAYVVSAGSGAYWAFGEAGSQMGFAGEVLKNSFMANLGSSMNPFGASPDRILMFGIGLVLLALGATTVLIGGRFLRGVIYFFFGYAFLTLLVVVGIFLSTSHAAFVDAYNNHASSFTASVPDIFTQAASKGYSPGPSLANLSAVIPLLFVSIGPYPVMQMVGGEIKNPRRSLLYGLVGAEILSIVIWFALTYLFDRVVGISFVEAWTIAPSAGGGYPPVPTIFTSVIAPNPFLAWLIFGGLFVSNIGWSWLGFVFVSRMVMSWSFDGLIPAKFADVSPRFHTPTFAVALAAVVAIVPMYLEFFTSFIATQVNSIFILGVIWILTSISAIVLPFRRRKIYESSSEKLVISGIPLVSILGAIGLAVFGYLAYYSITNPAVGPFSSGAQAFLGGILLVALGIYSVSQYYNKKKRGLDLSVIFNELPPE
jgi:APA family basic amino acid/polyamine antiporter